MRISLVIIFIVLASFVVSQSSSNVIVDSSVIKEIEDSEIVRVIIDLEYPDDLKTFRQLSVKGIDKESILKKRSQDILRNQDEVLQMLEKDDFIIINKFSYTPSLSGYLTKSGLEKLEKHPLVRRIYADQLGWYELQESVGIIHANDTWDLNTDGLNITGDGVSVCVIDTGIDIEHNNLGGCNWTQFLSGNCEKVPAGMDATGEFTTPDDYSGHGTRISGIIAANGGIKGVAPDSKIISIKNNNISGEVIRPWLSSTRAGVEFCIGNRTEYNIKAIVISSKFNGTDGNETTSMDNCYPENDLSQEIKIASELGIFVSIASGNAGNTNEITFPSCVEGAYSVGATYDYDGTYPCINDSVAEVDKMFCYSNRNEYLDFVAPGSKINSTDLDQSYSQESGTSYSAPMVAGVVALMSQANDNLTVDQTAYILNYTGKQIYDAVTGYYFPRINALNATLMALYSEFFEVSNDGDANLTVVNINSTAPWVTNVYPTSFVLEPGENMSVMVTVDLDDEQESGSYSTSIVIYSDDPDESTVNVNLFYQRVQEGCFGDCPPGSGDWTVENYTAIWFDGVDVSGNLNLQNVLFLGEQETNISEELAFTDGELRLDGSVLRFE